MYNLHIYFKGIEILHVTTYEWKNMNIMNSCILCRNLRRCKTPCIVLKSQTPGWDCSGSGIVSSPCHLKQLYFLRSRKPAKYSIWREFAIFIQHSHCMFVGNVIIMAKVSMSRVGTQWEEKEPWYRYWCGGIRLIIWWRETLFVIDFFFLLNFFPGTLRG